MTQNRVAILTDLHANLAAVQAVLADMDRQPVAEILGMGDFVGYNASPAEVVRA